MFTVKRGVGRGDFVVIVLRPPKMAVTMLLALLLPEA